jgi:YidC/Oxa1 family membrane protein insertase
MILAAGWFLDPVYNFFGAILAFFYGIIPNLGISIILLTILVMLVMFPLTAKQAKSMLAMQRAQPEIKKLQAKYKNDRAKLNEEMMKFYQENKINPLASCLPLALQMPVFISLFYMLRKDLRHDICPEINPPTVPNPKPCGSSEASQFFFIPDITDKATGAVLIVLVVMYIGSQLLSSVFMSTSADRNQRLIMMGLPFFFVPFVIGFPAGLLVYWITTNMWTVGQGIVVRRLAPHPNLATAGGGGTALPTGARAAAPERRRRSRDQEEDGAAAEKQPAAEPARAAAPPPPPRKKKKRSGRRR